MKTTTVVTTKKKDFVIADCTEMVDLALGLVENLVGHKVKRKQSEQVDNLTVKGSSVIRTNLVSHKLHEKNGNQIRTSVMR